MVGERPSVGGRPADPSSTSTLRPKRSLGVRVGSERSGEPRLRICGVGCHRLSFSNSAWDTEAPVGSRASRLIDSAPLLFCAIRRRVLVWGEFTDSGSRCRLWSWRRGGIALSLLITMFTWRIIYTVAK